MNFRMSDEVARVSFIDVSSTDARCQFCQRGSDPDVHSTTGAIENPPHRVCAVRVRRVRRHAFFLRALLLDCGVEGHGVIAGPGLQVRLAVGQLSRLQAGNPAVVSGEPGLSDKLRSDAS